MASLIWRIAHRVTRDWLVSGFRINRVLKRIARTDGVKRIWLFGAPAYINLGDHAQTLCELDWFRRFYPRREVWSFSTHELMSENRRLLNGLAPHIGPDDMIFFQSGYNLTDLYPKEEEMHREVARRHGELPIIFMPQTISFRNPYETNPFIRESAGLYRKCGRLLLLCRDKESEKIADEAFPGVKTAAFPDIVTTWIGTRRWNVAKRGILLCLRNDAERALDGGDLKYMVSRLEKNETVRRTDTSIDWPPGYFIMRNRAKYVEAMLREFARYRLVVTDRYHGLIFALVTGTPVIVLKTTDHKLTAGIDWFDGVMRDMIVLADDVKSACESALGGKRFPNSPLPPVFNERYYDRLKGLIDAEIKS